MRHYLDFNQISLVRILEQEGLKPEYEKNGSYWYKSPFRNKASPSLQVKKNVWHDFGSGERGGILDMMKKIYPNDSMTDLFERLRSGTGERASFEISKENAPERVHKTERILATYPLNNIPLLKYIEERGVSPTIAKRYCKTVLYLSSDRTKKLYGIGFQNDKGGYEVRSKFAKRAFAPKTISTIDAGTADRVFVYEGFMDFLSMETEMQKRGEWLPHDSIILNGVGQVQEAIPKLKEYKQVVTILDNDTAGQETTQKIALEIPQVVNATPSIGMAKDLNEALSSGQFRLGDFLKRVHAGDMREGEQKKKRKEVGGRKI